MAKLLLLVAICLAVCQGELVDVIQPTENPHMKEGSSTCSEGGQKCEAGLSSCPSLAGLDPTQIISTPVSTQQETLLAIVRKTYMGVEVPIYHFRQPSRLNPKQLPFKIVRMRSIPMEGLVVVPVDYTSAADSWFPEYSWDILMCQCSTWKHLGWKFTGKTTGHVFYALIVDYHEGKRRETAEGDRVLEALTVGVRAPAWMLALATATLGAQFSGNSPK